MDEVESPHGLQQLLRRLYEAHTPPPSVAKIIRNIEYRTFPNAKTLTEPTVRTWIGRSSKEVDSDSLPAEDTFLRLILGLGVSDEEKSRWMKAWNKALVKKNEAKATVKEPPPHSDTTAIHAPALVDQDFPPAHSDDAGLSPSPKALLSPATLSDVTATPAQGGRRTRFGGFRTVVAGSGIITAMLLTGSIATQPWNRWPWTSPACRTANCETGPEVGATPNTPQLGALVDPGDAKLAPLPPGSSPPPPAGLEQIINGSFDGDDNGWNDYPHPTVRKSQGCIDVPAHYGDYKAAVSQKSFAMIQDETYQLTFSASVTPRQSSTIRAVIQTGHERNFAQAILPVRTLELGPNKQRFSLTFTSATDIPNDAEPAELAELAFHQSTDNAAAYRLCVDDVSLTGGQPRRTSRP